MSACIMRLGRRCKDNVTSISRFTGKNNLTNKRELESNEDLEIFVPRLLLSCIGMAAGIFETSAKVSLTGD